MDKHVYGGKNRQRHCLHSEADKRPPKAQRSFRRGEPHIKKSDCHIHASLGQRLKAIHTLRFEHAIKTLCRVLRVNRSTYYKHFKVRVTPRDIENQELRSDILTIYTRSKKRLGAYKIRRRLLVEYGKQVSVGRVYRLMKSMLLPKMSTVKPVSTYPKTEQGECNNVLEQRFNQEAPNRVWVSDITYVRVAGRFCYLCVIIDLFARKVVAYKTSVKIDKRLTLDTLSLACSKRGYPKGVLFHSDRGSQYNAKDFRQAIDKLDFIQSFSAKGHPYDNAVAESFFKYLKKEDLNRKTFTTIEELNLTLFEYIEGFYNPRRPHHANDLLSPDEKETLFFNT
jgi:transposase InsO family protein